MRRGDHRKESPGEDLSRGSLMLLDDGGSAQRVHRLEHVGMRQTAGPNRSELCHCPVPHASCFAADRI
jgi:hypothetical protein